MLKAMRLRACDEAEDGIVECEGEGWSSLGGSEARGKICGSRGL